ncbi:isoprenyl transferase [bacterium]|nr:isoprenyl transferase [bacterium]
MATPPAPHAGSCVTAHGPRDEPPRPAAADRLPRHVAIIMDGNGRWARSRGLPRIEGHRRGVATVRRITEHCARLGIEQLTLYCLSSENWRRPAAELSFLMHLLEQYMIEERSLLMREGIRLAMIGRREGLPAATLEALDTTATLCASNTGMRLCLAINYGSRGEIVDAARRLAAEVRAGRLEPEAIDEELFASRLDTAGMPDPDLLIRTAGEMRISNFLLWQISYAELWVTDVAWPDFMERHLDEAFAAFAARERRFGGLSIS